MEASNISWIWCRFWVYVHACTCALSASVPTRRTSQSPRAVKCRGRQFKSSTCVFNYVNNQLVLFGWRGGSAELKVCIGHKIPMHRPSVHYMLVCVYHAPVFGVSLSLSLCVCVCVREREREKLSYKKLITDLEGWARNPRAFYFRSNNCFFPFIHKIPITLHYDILHYTTIILHYTVKS